MKIFFHGAAREVTGSCHRIESDAGDILLDCGMIQGGRERHLRNREPFAFDAKTLDAVVLSHAHIDHSGRLPLLLRAGYRGRVLTTEATASLCRILLADSAHIHEEDARWKIKRLKKRGEDWRWVTPLFTAEEAAEAIERLEPVRCDESRALGDHCDAHAGGTQKRRRPSDVAAAPFAQRPLGVHVLRQGFSVLHQVESHARPPPLVDSRRTRIRPSYRFQ